MIRTYALLAIAFVLALSAGIADAQCHGRRSSRTTERVTIRSRSNVSQYNCGGSVRSSIHINSNLNLNQQAPICPQGNCPVPGKIGTAIDALDEVNRARATRGLPAFARCDQLTAAAMSAASFRAGILCEGHCPGGDFRFVPAGGNAIAAGCAAWPAGLGWGSCCTYERFSTAGAAYVVGSDGRRYMHLFVR